MTPQQTKRFSTLGLVGIVGVGVALFLFSAMQENMMYFMTPTEVQAKSPTEQVRLGGMVEKGSVQRNADTLSMTFNVTDFTSTVPVTFTGVVPDLFREGQGVVAEGKWQNGLFTATKILAKHDENYMPPQVQTKG